MITASEAKERVVKQSTNLDLLSKQIVKDIEKSIKFAADSGLNWCETFYFYDLDNARKKAILSFLKRNGYKAHCYDCSSFDSLLNTMHYSYNFFVEWQ